MAEEARRGIRIAVEGCGHGELDRIYDTVRLLEQQDGRKIDLLICCGDFQAVRNKDDLECMACPPKYRSMASFWRYYKGDAVAPVPTLFIGGNHEAANHLQELCHGGWAAPGIYYLGHAGVVRFGGLRIGGLSGIYKSHDYRTGHYEAPPYNNSTMRSAYHIRELDVHRLLRLQPPLDIFLSHDWPQGIARHGDVGRLLQRKAFLRSEIDDNSLGSPPAAQLLAHLRPSYWFSAHLHTKFAALVPHPGGPPTRFLALDKCLPGRSFLQVIDFPDAPGPPEFAYDEEWLAVMRATHALTAPRRVPPPLLPKAPAPPGEAELAEVRSRLATAGGPRIPDNFVQTAPAYDPSDPAMQRGRMPRAVGRNPQTVALLELLGLDYNLDSVPSAEGPAADGGGGGYGGRAGSGRGGGRGGLVTGANAVPAGGYASTPLTADAIAAAARQQPYVPPAAADDNEIELGDDAEDEGPPPSDAPSEAAGAAAAGAAAADPDEIDLEDLGSDEAAGGEQQQLVLPALAAAMQGPPT